MTMSDLTTRYMGLELSSPLVAASSPLTGSLTSLRALEDHGAAAVVLPSLYEEVLRRERERYECLCDAGADCCHEVSGAYFPDQLTDHAGADPYLNLVRRAKDALGIPVIASVCGVTLEGWVTLAGRVAQAGADGVELNLGAFMPDAEESGEALDRSMSAVIQAVKESVDVPVGAKLGASFTSFGDAASRFHQAGADALILFHRIHYPDMDLPRLRWCHELPLPAGSSRDLRPALTWLARLYGRVGASLGATGGVRSGDDCVKCVLAGADAVMVASLALQEGPGAFSTLTDGLRAWLGARGFDSVAAARGLLSRARLDGTGSQGPGAGGPSVSGIPAPVVSDVQL